MAIVKSLPATKTLSNQLKYLQKEGKTRENLKEGINCDVENIEREFNTIKLLHGKTEGKQYYHFTQAFSPEDNITPEKANELGKEWIQNNIKDHQVYIVTHIDKDHIHNHFVINSVNIESGKKLQITPKKLFEMKNDSNRICEREGFKKIDVNKKADIKKTMAELGMELRGITTWKEELRQCVDFARERSNNLEELKENLKSNFEIITRETKNSISFKHPEQGKSVRGKNLGNKYTKEEIENGFIRQNTAIREKRADRVQEDNSRGEGQTVNQTTRAEHEGENGIRKHPSERELGNIEATIRGIEQEVTGNSKRKTSRDNEKLQPDTKTSSGIENKQRDVEPGHRPTTKQIKPKVRKNIEEIER
ncbi:relaxase/mobilization nuclease domain-containing protein [Clostridium lacusfryxellense]|uniref:relaxase/mobilization nuclease domain-containing protein n=1 Tax=Clostridium lacusfryxellense TaxID=205328 RepID=UPI001C0B2794|nr:relaxase/mobilization nuclease domain-containing protein [Clostridium lacusfryxellense]MBU3114702.1 relaxase/mobilization nuclease domain-containing protein [Clostridium lacusfryxellense]